MAEPAVQPDGRLSATRLCALGLPTRRFHQELFKLR